MKNYLTWYYLAIYMDVNLLLFNWFWFLLRIVIFAKCSERTCLAKGCEGNCDLIHSARCCLVHNLRCVIARDFLQRLFHQEYNC